MDKKVFVTVAIACTIALAVLGYAFYHAYSTPIKVVEYDMQVYVGNRIGFNAGVDKIWFGIVPPGGQGARHFDLNNTYNFPVNIKVTATGDLSKWTGVSNITSNPFVLEPGQAQRLEIVLNVPEDVPADDASYEGKLTIRSYRIFDLF